MSSLRNEEGATRRSRWQPEVLRTSASREDRGLLGHPKGLPWMLNVELWERFSYYGMKAILLYFIIDQVSNGGLGIAKNTGQVILAVYGAAVFLLAIPGAIFADRIIGPWLSTFYGGMVIMAGHLCLTIPINAIAWVGICLVAIGTGFIKPNLSTIVGGLYDADDPRRDAGFQLFYMSVNLGALVSPIVVSFLQKHWGYHAGFSAAAIGMALALVAFIYGRHKLSAFAFDIPNPLTGNDKRNLIIGSLLAVIGCAVLYMIMLWVTKSPTGAIANLIFVVATGSSIAYFVTMFRSPKVTATERTHLLAYIPLWIGAVLFFMIFEQASGKMATFAADNTNGHITGALTIDPAVYQSVNPLAIVLLAPLVGWFFTKRAGKIPTTAMKFAFAVMVIGLSALMMGYGFGTWTGGAKLAPWWFLALAFVIQTIGELFLSPVGLSTTTALAPKAFASQAMALWLLASATGQGIAAVVIDNTAKIPDSTYYYGLGVVTIIVSLALFAVAPWTQSKMADVGIHE